MFDETIKGNRPARVPDNYWQPAVLSGGQKWRLVKGGRDLKQLTKNGRVWLCNSYETAKRQADELNKRVSK